MKYALISVEVLQMFRARMVKSHAEQLHFIDEFIKVIQNPPKPRRQQPNVVPMPKPEIKVPVVA